MAEVEKAMMGVDEAWLWVFYQTCIIAWTKRVYGLILFDNPLSSRVVLEFESDHLMFPGADAIVRV